VGDLLTARRRHLAAKGRPMTLRRQTANNPAVYTDLAVIGFLRSYRPQEMQGDVRQGDAEVALTNDELGAVGVAPRARDLILIDGRTWAIQNATPVYDGLALAGFTLWVRGG
jgi:hypothetical protein